jgi:hypothetical protein
MTRRAQLIVGLVGPGVLVLALSSTAHAASINVSPSTATAGSTVTVSGDVLANGQPGCQAPGPVTLISDAFAGPGEFAGVPAVSAPVDAAGSFSTTVHLSSSATSGSHQVTGRCGGANLGVTATITITALAPSGPSVAGQPLASALAAAGALVALGALLIEAGRRRSRSVQR